MQEGNEFQRRRLTHIVYILFVGKTQHKNPCTLDALVMRIERVNDFSDNIIGHAGIDVAGKLYELCMKVIFPGLPGKVKGVYRNAVATESGAGIKGMETKRFCPGSMDNLPDIYVPYCQNTSSVH